VLAGGFVIFSGSYVTSLVSRERERLANWYFGFWDGGSLMETVGFFWVLEREFGRLEGGNWLFHFGNYLRSLLEKEEKKSNSGVFFV